MSVPLRNWQRMQRDWKGKECKWQGTSGVPGLAKRRRGPDGLTERSMLRRLLWKPTPNFRAGREEGSKQRVSGKGPGARFLKTLKTFRSRKDIVKSRTL